MSFEELSDKHLLDRVAFLTENMEKIWEEINPKIDEFNEKKEELALIWEELSGREFAEHTREDTQG
jgi:hypothetical protein